MPAFEQEKYPSKGWSIWTGAGWSICSGRSRSFSSAGGGQFESAGTGQLDWFIQAVDTSSGNVGLAAATKAVSRWIGIVAGIMVLIAGFFPRISLLISIIPPPVVGAALTFAIVYMVITGFQEIFSVKLDQKKIAVVGLSMIFSLCTQFVPELFAYLPKSLQIIFSNSLTSSTLLAILLYQFFHLDNTYTLILKKIKR